MTPKGRKARALLAYLVSDPGAKISKGLLATLLWGDRGDEQARSSLRQALFELRRSVNASRDIVRSDREHIWVQADAVVEDPGHENGHYKEAFQDLDGITPEFDEWLAAERLRRSKLRLVTLKTEAEGFLRKGRADDALTLVEKMQAIDPHDEDALCLAMKAEFARAHPAAIAERYQATAALMHADLGVQPSQETQALRDRLIKVLTGREEQPVSEADQKYLLRRRGGETGADRRAETLGSREVRAALGGHSKPDAAAPEGNDKLQGSHEGGGAQSTRFLRKSMIIHAVRWFKPGDHPAVHMESGGDAGAYVETPEGRLRVEVGDWIITGISGENYPCKPEVFDQLYVTVD